MARHTIYNKHGKPTDYFWSDKYAADPERVTVFRQTEGGIKKMTGVIFDSKAGKIVKQ
ncbi:MAG: hypothetical protein ACT443_10900 [Gemmatimonadota bacterium]